MNKDLITHEDAIKADFIKLYEEYSSTLYSYILMTLRKDQTEIKEVRDVAKDIVQETFIDVYELLKKNPDFFEEKKFLPYIILIARKKFVDQISRQNKLPLLTINP